MGCCAEKVPVDGDISLLLTSYKPLNTLTSQKHGFISTLLFTRLELGLGGGGGGGVNVPERRLLYSSRLYSFAKVPKKTEQL